MSGRVLSLGPLLNASTAGPRAEVRAFPGAGGARTKVAPTSPPADPDAFRRQVLPHLDAAYGFARYLCRDAAAAEDIVQDACLRAFRGFHGYRGGDAKAWLLAIVRSSFLDWIRERRRWDALASDEPAEELPDESPSAEAILLRADGDAAVRNALEALPDPFREALVLRELEDMAYRDIAAITGVPIGTVMSRLARARRLLATALTQEGAQ
ncbi:MAG TPA: sigma-70 family RNA polymerase sigma factor [Caulobacteraceae bacterium]|jgi:RNA polymerase sigma-70 factor (ECF subfamily)|nr:sigma-70 family RNA polymerase sigma factor [Caulobacteraceae bacterium]